MLTQQTEALLDRMQAVVGRVTPARVEKLALGTTCDHSSDRRPTTNRYGTTTATRGCEAPGLPRP
jgi:hypothetical protein